jgi:hypothetical protein
MGLTSLSKAYYNHLLKHSQLTICFDSLLNNAKLKNQTFTYLKQFLIMLWVDNQRPSWDLLLKKTGVKISRHCPFK